MKKESYMRLYYPYCMKKLFNGNFVFLNRDYFPLGTRRKNWLEEKDYINMLLKCPQFNYPITHYPEDYFEESRQGKEIVYSTLDSCYHFYLEHNPPWECKAFHTQYEKKIRQLNPTPDYVFWDFEWFRRGCT